MTTTETTIAIAPRHPLGSGKSTPGGHYKAYRAQPLFAPTDTLELVTTAVRWRDGTPGHAFYMSVLSKRPATVADALALGKDAGLKGREVQNHLRWFYTWAGDLKVNGQVYAAAEPVAPVSEPEPVAPKAKGKGRK